MGCDIHGYIEVKKNKKWVVEGPVPDTRSYDIFGLLFGVRNYVNAKPIAEFRGTPSYTEEELEERSKIEMCESVLAGYPDYHSHTFITGDDIKNYDFTQKFPDSRDGDKLVSAKEILEASEWAKIIKKHEDDEWRAVVCFDN